VQKNKIIFLIGLCLSLAVGCRPHYVLFIPIFFIIILYLEYSNGKYIKNIIKPVVCFIIPCIIYATVLALYNYLRFDSVFEFGCKYQLNDENLFNYTPHIRDFIIGLRYHLLQIPEIVKDSYVVFSLVGVKNNSHRLGNELITGVIFVCPLSFLILMLPFILKKINKKLKVAIILLTLLFIVNFCMACMFGMVQRYVFEYIYILGILALIVFYMFKKYVSNKNIKNILVIFFLIIFVFTMYINISFLFCPENLKYFLRPENEKFYKIFLNVLF